MRIERENGEMVEGGRKGGRDRDGGRVREIGDRLREAGEMK